MQQIHPVGVLLGLWHGFEYPQEAISHHYILGLGALAQQPERKKEEQGKAGFHKGSYFQHERYKQNTFISAASP